MTKKRKKKKWPRVIGIALLSVVAICAVAGFLIYNYASKKYSGDKAHFYVDASNGEDALRDSLVTNLGESYGGRVYTIWHKLADVKYLKSGYYEVEPGEKAWKLAVRIKNGRQNPLDVKFNNLRTYGQLMARLDAQLLTDSASLAAAADSILSAKGVSHENFVSHFLPDTYEFYWTESAPAVIDKIVANYDRFWTDDRRDKASKLHLTPEQVSTLASIVEEETNKKDERPTVARVYLNRLDKNMKLEADPTLKFAAGDFSIKRVLNKHKQIDSPYNTYMYAGLPPGPIRLPEASTLDAVLNAPVNNYLFLCAKEDFSGYHNFASDYSTHQSNARRYQAELDKKGY